MTEIKKILNEFVKECSEKLGLGGIIQFGSSTYSADFDDIDLLLISSQDVLLAKEQIKLISIVKDFENRYKEIVFDFGGVADRERKGNFSISAIFVGKKDIQIKHNPHDLFFYKSLSEDKNVKLLFGKNVLDSKRFVLTSQHLFEMLSVDQKHALRKIFEKNQIKSEAFYHLFKTFLRVMLVNEGNFKKDELLRQFKEKFGNEIKLPKNSKDLIKNKIKKEDFEDILKFTEDCLRWLSK